MFVQCATLLCVIVWQALLLPTQATVTVDKRAYKNVVVSFSPSLSPDKSTQILQSTKQILKETSSVLQKAIGIQIGSVVFHVPLTWDPTTLEGVTSISPATMEIQSDIRIESMTDSAFGPYPVALQHGGCGVPGLKINVPEEFLTSEDSYSKGKILAREWLKYRYGVFDEHGFDNDSMYPSYYSIPGSDDVRVTDCTFPQLKYNFRDSDGNNCSLLKDEASDCSAHPETSEETTSSLMYFHKEITSMEHVCGDEDHPHNPYSPSKQNLLCSYKSIWEIIQTSDDVNEKRSSQSGINEMEFSYIQDSRLRVVVTFQNTKSLENQKYSILSTIRKFWYDAPLQSKLALYAFKDNVEENRALTELASDEDRTVNIISSFQKPVEDACVSCALNKAIDVLSSDSSNDPGSIVVMTGSDATENKEIIEKLNTFKLCLIIVGFPGASKERWQPFVDASSCSSYWEIADSYQDPQKFEILSQAFESILPAPLNNARTKTVTTGFLSTQDLLPISADMTASSYTLWVFETVESDNIYCRLGDELLEMNEKLRTENLLAVSFDAPSEEVKCGLNYASSPHLAQVQMTTKPGAYFDNSAWVLDTTPQGTEQQMPVIIYAKVNYGLYPVIKCDVKALVTSPEGGETGIQLLDDGRGDPDITKSDGIYSGYFTQIEKEGDYKVIVVANDNKGEAKFGKNGKTPCCGSAVIIEEDEVSPLEWTYETTFRAISKKPEEGYKPSRILDLKVDKLDLPNSVTLKWTAPGGEMSNGQVSSYEFHMYCEYKDCNEYGVLPKWIGFSGKMKPKPKEYGREQKVTFQFHSNRPSNLTVRFRMKALNKNHQHGSLSNFALVEFVSEELPELTTPGNPESQNPTDKVNVGLIIAYVIIAIASLLLIGGLIYFGMIKSKQTRLVEDQTVSVVVRPNENGTVNGGFIFKSPELSNKNPEINRSASFPVLLYTHQQIKDCKNKSQDPPLYEANKLSKPWASTRALFSNEYSSSDSKFGSSEIEQLDNE